MRHSSGLRAGTRQVLKKKPRQRGMFPLSKIMYQYRIGEKIIIDIEPSVHKGMPHPRFNGRIGEVIGRQGRAYIVKIKDGKKFKQIIARAEHLRPLNGFQ